MTKTAWALFAGLIVLALGSFLYLNSDLFPEYSVSLTEGGTNKEKKDVVAPAPEDERLTHTNKHGFSFKYPAAYKVNGEVGESDLAAQPLIYVWAPDNKNHPVLEIQVLEPESYTAAYARSFDDYVRYAYDAIDAEIDVGPLTSMTVGGSPARTFTTSQKYTGTDGPEGVPLFVTEGSQRRIIFVKNADRVFWISYRADDAEAQRTVESVSFNAP